MTMREKLLTTEVEEAYERNHQSEKVMKNEKISHTQREKRKQKKD